MLLRKIGTSPEGLTDLADLGVPFPMTEIPWAETEELGSGQLRQVGPKHTNCNIGVLEYEAHATLRTYCPNASAEVYIELEYNDETSAVYKAIMRWPRDNAPDGWVPDAQIEFILIEEIIGS
jgi:hypothetical protein